MNENLIEWIEDNHLSANFESNNILTLKGFEGKFLVVEEKELTFDDRFILNLYDHEIDLLDTDIEYLLFRFGSFWFYHHKDKDTELNFFRYLGESSYSPSGIPFIGIHGKYEICNGSREYSDWIQKAKFLRYTSVGICEAQTLAGNHYFQLACDKAGIKAIHGRTTKIQSHNGVFYFVKSFVKNSTGWKNLLKIHNTEIIVRGNSGQFITEVEFTSLSEGLIHIIVGDTDLNNVDLSLYDLKNTFFQFDPVEYVSDSKDKQHLLEQKKYLEEYIDKIKPILLQDCYYLDKGDGEVKNVLNQISKKVTQYRSENQYLKPFDKVLEEMYVLFDKKESLFGELMEESFKQYKYIEQECNFKIEKTGMHLPKYRMNEDEAEIYRDSEEMFFALLEKGFNERVKGRVKDESVYWERIEKEVLVLQEGGVIDYFLILYDVFNFMKKTTGIVSVGRGSSAGSLVSYLLGIVQIDPIKYNLLFERFLDKARVMTGSLPDIDSDIPSEYRQTVIEYLVNKYGRENVASIGTTQNFKLKSALKDLLRLKGVDIKTANILTSMITVDDNLYGFTKLFEVAVREKRIKEVINNYPELPYYIYLMLNQPRSTGVHAAGIVIFPDTDEHGNKTTAADYLSLRYSDDQLVTEWEKDAIEDQGFLKADLLGLAQLDKIIRMNELILQNGGTYKEFLDIDLEDPKILELFRRAVTEDVFQFNTDVQKAYLLQLQPEGIEDLIAANALNRPGAMESNSHIKYIKIKDGIEPEEKLPLIDDLLTNTRSLLVYQEQVMFAYQRLTNCDLEETNKFRKILSKSKPGRVDPDIEKYKQNFINGYLSKGISQQDAEEVWEKIVGFVSYSFNRSHAAAYAITGFWAAYYKAYHPLEFYTSSLELVKTELLPRLISEIYTSNLINLVPPDINKSGWRYSIEKKTNSIYWSLISVKFAGETAVSALLKEREEGGEFFSFEEFIERVKGTKVNKRVIINLILTGCFDNIEKITEEKERLRLLEDYSKMIGQDVAKEHKEDPNHTHNFYWILIQKQLCGLGVIVFENLFKRVEVRSNYVSYSYTNPQLLQEETLVGKKTVVAGILKEGRERSTRKGAMCQLLLDCNDNLVYITLWSETYEKYKAEIEKAKNKPVFVNGVVVYDDFKKTNVIQSDNSTRIHVV